MPQGRPSEQQTSSKSVPIAVSAPSTGPGIRSMFDRIAADYDRFNAWASLGLHQHWRKALIRRIPEGVRVLDIATGTGDVAFLAAQRGHPVVGLDFSERMLAQAREKDKAGRIRWVSGSADHLPFSDRSFGCITSAFALRNLRGCLEGVFNENFRVLRAGAKVFHMDFGRPKSVFSRWGHRIHLQFGIPLIGQMVCKDKWPKGYLENTIREFFEPHEVMAMLVRAGFEGVRHTVFSLGVVQLFEGTKNC